MLTTVEVIPSSAPAGAEVRGVNLHQEISANDLSQIEAALHAHGVIFFRGQTLSPEQQVRFSRRFGELETPVLEQYTVPNFRDVMILSNVMKDDKPVGLVDAGRFWHSDSTYRPEPARCSLLHALEVPVAEDGASLGDTWFVRTDRAYDRLAPDMKARLADMKARHSFAVPYERHYNKDTSAIKRDKMTEEQKKATPECIHPVVRTHPATGRKCLYVNEGLTAGFVGMDDAQSEALLYELCEGATPQEEVYRHRWQLGDLLIWDNCMTQHRATGGLSWPQHRRYMHRTTVRGSVPF